MIWLLLIIAFLQVGALSFGGGYAALPLIQHIIVDKYHWLSQLEMTDIITISQLTPGPISINAASFVGTKLGGILGSICATVGNVLPQFILLLLLSRYWFKGGDTAIIDKVLKGLRPGVVGLILTASLRVIHNALLPQRWDFIALASFSLGMVVLTIAHSAEIPRPFGKRSEEKPPRCRRQPNVIFLIGCGAVIGLIGGLLSKSIG